ncbi:MAG: bifunctional riboflavin kinase/FAD synthetase [Candidatus Margulisiibacteriota bacterium]
MKIILHPKKKSLKGAIVALGTFDGVHRGHRKILKKAVAYAKKHCVAALAVTFDPHPQQLIVPERGLRLLTTIKEREELFCQTGIDGVVVIKFGPHLRSLNYREFAKKYLFEKLGIKHVVVGFDYAFGSGRGGNVNKLRELGKKLGFAVDVVPAVTYQNHPVKSRLIREMVARGQFGLARRWLGHSYPVSGKVVRGEGRGKRLGFPTANLQVDSQKLVPAYGVYAGVTCFRGKKYRCCVNIGARPTFGVGQAAIEVHLIGFKGNLLGRALKVYLLHRLRDEIHFSDVEDLKRQIRRDIILACGKVQISI